MRALQRDVERLLHATSSGLTMIAVDVVPVFMYKEAGQVCLLTLSTGACLPVQHRDAIPESRPRRSAEADAVLDLHKSATHFRASPFQQDS